MGYFIVVSDGSGKEDVIANYSYTNYCGKKNSACQWVGKLAVVFMDPGAVNRSLERELR
jgi:hypothetical protein